MEMLFWPIFDDSPSTSIMIMEDFHDYTMVILSMITIFLLTFMTSLINSKFKNLFLFEGQILELIWTILPMVILIFIAYPSLFYLYMLDLSLNPSVTMKVFGVQWYWIYELSDFSQINITSYIMEDEQTLNMHSSVWGWRSVFCDSSAVLPYNTEVRIMVTSQDVIHSFAMPGLGLKVDAVPGRLNWTSVFVKRPGLYFGQCSEICGIGHAFMPISVEFISKTDFINFIKSKMS